VCWVHCCVFILLLQSHDRRTLSNLLSPNNNDILNVGKVNSLFFWVVVEITFPTCSKAMVRCDFRNWMFDLASCRNLLDSYQLYCFATIWRIWKWLTPVRIPRHENLDTELAFSCSGYSVALLLLKLHWRSVFNRANIFVCWFVRRVSGDVGMRAHDESEMVTMWCDDDWHYPRR